MPASLDEYEAATSPAPATSTRTTTWWSASDPAALEEMRAYLAQLFASAGVSGDEEVVLYDETGGMRAARSVWFLEYLGHPRVRFLDGGFQAWRAAGGPVSRDVPAAPRPAAFAARPRPDVLADLRLRRRPPEPARRDHPRHPQRGRAQGRGNSRTATPAPGASPAPSGWSGGASSTPKDACPDSEQARRPSGGRPASPPTKRSSSTVTAAPARPAPFWPSRSWATRASATSSAPGTNGLAAPTCPPILASRRHA